MNSLATQVKDVEWRMVGYDDPREVLTPSETERLSGRAHPYLERTAEGGRFKAVVASFSLRSSHYATMAVREATKTSSARDVQGALSVQHDAEKEEESNGDEGLKRSLPEVQGEGDDSAKRAKLEEAVEGEKKQCD